MILLWEFQVALYIALNLLSLYTLSSALNLFLKHKNNLNISIRIFIWIAYLSIGSFTYFWNFSSVFNIIIEFFLVLVVMIGFGGGIKNKLIIALSWSTFIVISELIIGICYSIVTNIPLDNIVIDDFSKLIGAIMAALFTLIIVKTFQLYRRNKDDFERFSFFDSFQVGIIPLCSIFIMHTFKELVKNYGLEVQWFVVISLLSIVFINLFFYYLFDKLRKIERVKYDNELLKKQTQYYMELEKNINLSFEKIRILKHDMNHHLLYFKSKLADNTQESINEAGCKIDLLIGEILLDDTKMYTQNLKLNRLLNYKLFQVNNIAVDVKVSMKAESVIDENSLYIILGNGIDNAVRCFDNSKALEEKLTVKILDDNNNLFIKITNPYAGNLNFKNGLPLTTKKNKSMHGVGLQSIKKLVEDKNGYFKITSENNIFCLEILLYDEIRTFSMI